MNSIGPLYRKLLLIAFALYLIGVCYIQCDLYRRMGAIEHFIAHERFDAEMKQRHAH